jgi:hypothetical protein
VAQAFDAADTTNTVGCPSFAFLAKGGYPSSSYPKNGCVPSVPSSVQSAEEEKFLGRSVELRSGRSSIQ